MKDTVSIPATAVRGTDRALLCDVGAKDGRRHWIPQSLIDDDSEVYKPGQTGELVIPEWFALKEGLI
jgi:hypothetical protein